MEDTSNHGVASVVGLPTVGLVAVVCAWVAAGVACEVPLDLVAQDDDDYPRVKGNSDLAFETLFILWCLAIFIELQYSVLYPLNNYKPLY